MLELRDIKKDYLSGENTVHALKGISLKFRSSEFISILGQSGCGKTTMLNIIGGLDKYTTGDLIINGKSTKNFKDRDWDAYRNHSIGFVFQSYNLIPHQSVLQNVELALTLSGVSKKERVKRAKQALIDVGLESQMNKRPSEMSGGQMQRVAIARAIVNNPDIILADEPTGALDSTTSVQIMEILKNLAKDRLVIMVTHNPELAKTYSTRIINMLDGEITNDSAPLSDEEIKAETKKNEEELKKTGKKKTKKPSMSFFTSLSLSLKNLFTKKGRTMLTSFAGSIGIIGIALIYAISNGLSTYINTVQEETLSSYPISIEETTTDLTSLMETFMNINKENTKHDKDAVYKKSSIYEITNALSSSNKSENDLTTFKKYIDGELKNKDSEFSKAISGVQYTYKIQPQIYTKDSEGNIIHSDTSEIMTKFMADYMNLDANTLTSFSNQSSAMGGMSQYTSMSSSVWQEMLSDKDGKNISPLITNQYDLVYGDWPKEYNEIVLILDKNNELNDLTLYAIGLEPKEDIDRLMNAMLSDEEISDQGKNKWTYEEAINADLRLVLNSDCYSLSSDNKTYSDLRESENGLNYLYDNGVKLKVAGIIKPAKGSNSTILTGSIGYTKELTNYLINSSNDSDIIKKQLDNPDTDVLTNLPFETVSSSENEDSKAKAFTDYISSLSTDKKAEIYYKLVTIPTTEVLDQMTGAALENISTEQMMEVLKQSMMTQMNMDEATIESYIKNMSDDDIKEFYTQAVQTQILEQYKNEAMSSLQNVTPDVAASSLDEIIKTLNNTDIAMYYDNIMEFSDSTYDDNLTKLGYVSLDTPSVVNLYSSSFEDKDKVKDLIDDYNKGKEELKQIKYTDYVGIMMNSVTSIINAITYVLIAFVSISLIVSSIMIGVITLISVQERTKEIGILRSIGASKKNVSSMFNAETMLIGFSSGLLGVIVTYLLCIPINIVIYKLTNIYGLKAFLPPVTAIILIVISILLTLIAGIIPSRSAAKKDPVVALRTE